jgi:hypothetical protein
MKVVFSTLFRKDLAAASNHYRSISPKLGTDFDERVKATVRTVIAWKGGDHVGPHGFPCRLCRPFPYLLYYEISQETLHVIGLVHERRHPNFLKARLS